MAVLASALVVAGQPVDSPWWTYADADASYAASSLNLLLGRDVRFVEHPGLPLTETGAIAFGADFVLRGEGRSRYVRETLLDLDRARPVFRGLAIAFYLLGALLACVLAARLLGHWTWGLAGGLLWLAAPGLVPMSIQFRPDVALAVLCLVFAFLIGRAVETRSAGGLVAAAFVAGLAVMLKLHALGLVVPLFIAALWRPPRRDWGRRLGQDITARLHRYKWPLGALALAWVAAVVAFNWERVPFTPTGAQALSLLVLLGGSAAYGIVALLCAGREPRLVRRVFRPELALVVAAYVAGLLLPVTLDLPDGLQALVNVAKTSTGSGTNTGVESFGTPFWEIGDLVAFGGLLVLGLAGLAGVLGLVRGDPRPVVWASGAVVLGVLAFARPPAVHYFAPAFVLALPAALWVLQRTQGAAAPLLVWPVILFVVWTPFHTRDAPTVDTERFAARVAPARALVERRLGPLEVAYVPPNWPVPDSRYFEFVHLYVDYTPERRYRFLPTTRRAAEYVAAAGLQPRFYIRPAPARLDPTGLVDLGEAGVFAARPVPGSDVVLELLSER